jgi:hypothetical protein
MVQELSAEQIEHRFRAMMERDGYFEIVEPRVTTMYHTCRRCGMSMSPRTMYAIFRRNCEGKWAVHAWECLSCVTKRRLGKEEARG